MSKTLDDYREEVLAKLLPEPPRPPNVADVLTNARETCNRSISYLQRCRQASTQQQLQQQKPSLVRLQYDSGYSESGCDVQGGGSTGIAAAVEIRPTADTTEDTSVRLSESVLSPRYRAPHGDTCTPESTDTQRYLITPMPSRCVSRKLVSSATSMGSFREAERGGQIDQPSPPAALRTRSHRRRSAADSGNYSEAAVAAAAAASATAPNDGDGDSDDDAGSANSWALHASFTCGDAMQPPSAGAARQFRHPARRLHLQHNDAAAAAAAAAPASPTPHSGPWLPAKTVPAEPPDSLCHPEPVVRPQPPTVRRPQGRQQLYRSVDPAGGGPDIRLVSSESAAGRRADAGGKDDCKADGSSCGDADGDPYMGEWQVSASRGHMFRAPSPTPGAALRPTARPTSRPLVAAESLRRRSTFGLHGAASAVVSPTDARSVAGAAAGGDDAGSTAPPSPSGSSRQMRKTVSCLAAREVHESYLLLTADRPPWRGPRADKGQQRQDNMFELRAMNARKYPSRRSRSPGPPPVGVVGGGSGGGGSPLGEDGSWQNFATAGPQALYGNAAGSLGGPERDGLGSSTGSVTARMSAYRHRIAPLLVAATSGQAPSSGSNSPSTLQYRSLANTPASAPIPTATSDATYYARTPPPGLELCSAGGAGPSPGALRGFSRTFVEECRAAAAANAAAVSASGGGSPRGVAPDHDSHRGPAAQLLVAGGRAALVRKLSGGEASSLVRKRSGGDAAAGPGLGAMGAGGRVFPDGDGEQRAASWRKAAAAAAVDGEREYDPEKGTLMARLFKALHDLRRSDAD